MPHITYSRICVWHARHSANYLRALSPVMVLRWSTTTPHHVLLFYHRMGGGTPSGASNQCIWRPCWMTYIPYRSPARTSAAYDPYFPQAASAASRHQPHRVHGVDNVYVTNTFVYAKQFGRGRRLVTWLRHTRVSCDACDDGHDSARWYAPRHHTDAYARTCCPHATQLFCSLQPVHFALMDLFLP